MTKGWTGLSVTARGRSGIRLDAITSSRIKIAARIRKLLNKRETGLCCVPVQLGLKAEPGPNSYEFATECLL